MQSVIDEKIVERFDYLAAATEIANAWEMAIDFAEDASRWPAWSARTASEPSEPSISTKPPRERKPKSPIPPPAIPELQYLVGTCTGRKTLMHVAKTLRVPRRVAVGWWYGCTEPEPQQLEYIRDVAATFNQLGGASLRILPGS